MTTLADQSKTYADEVADTAHGQHLLETLLQRAYMAGALAALTSKAPRDDLLAECVAFGRSIGTSHEGSATAPDNNDRRAVRR